MSPTGSRLARDVTTISAYRVAGAAGCAFSCYLACHAIRDVAYTAASRYRVDAAARSLISGLMSATMVKPIFCRALCYRLSHRARYDDAAL